ncbi:MAG: hypothetical protein V1811_01010 [Candidatus Micrarchaeota archaeon]
MMAEIKKTTKPVSSQQPQETVQLQQPSPQQLTITMPSITVRVDKEFKAKIPFLFLLLLLFSFALVMFERANFSTMDIVDLQRFDYHIQKAYSISFIIFVLLFSASLGIAIFFGARISRLLSLLVFPITMIPALILGSFYPPLMAPYIAFALTVLAGALIAAFYREPSFSNVWGTASKALLVLLVLSFFIVFDKVASNKDSHMDAFFNNAATMLPANIGGSPAGNAALLQSTMYEMPTFKPFYDNYAKIIGLVAVSLVAIMNIFIQLFAAATAYFLAKL